MHTNRLSPTPSWCDKEVDQPLPNDIVINIDKGLVSVIVRRIAASEYLIVPKYRQSVQGSWETPLLGPLERIVSLYAPRAVRKAMTYANTVWSPSYNTYIPIEHVSKHTNNIYICSGRKIINEQNITELDAYSNYKLSLIYNKLMNMRRLSLNSITACSWPTGSILMGSFRQFSDIDLVLNIDEPNCYKKITNFIEEFGYRKDLETAVTNAYLLKEAKWRNIDPQIMRNAIKKWQRLRINNTEVSISIVSIYRRLSPETRIFKISDPSEIVTKTLYVEPYQQSIGDYPVIVQSNEEYIVSFDGIFAPLLFEGGKVFVRGIRGRISYGTDSIEAIIIGISEQVTYAYTINS